MPMQVKSEMRVYDPSRIILDDSRVMLQILASVTDNSRGVIYNRNVFMVQVNGDQGYNAH